MVDIIGVGVGCGKEIGVGAVPGQLKTHTPSPTGGGIEKAASRRNE